ncbi:MAG: hypothetical protein ACXWH1_11405 [Thermoanaerobaculia bacterium]
MRGQQFFVGGGPGDLLDLYFYVRVRFFELGDHLRDDFAFAAQAPELDCGFVLGACAGAGEEKKRIQNAECRIKN